MNCKWISIQLNGVDVFVGKFCLASISSMINSLTRFSSLYSTSISMAGFQLKSCKPSDPSFKSFGVCTLWRIRAAECLNAHLWYIPLKCVERLFRISGTLNCGYRVNNIYRRHQARKITLDCEGVRLGYGGRLCLLQIATPQMVYVFGTYHLRIVISLTRVRCIARWPGPVPWGRFEGAFRGPYHTEDCAWLQVCHSRTAELDINNVTERIVLLCTRNITWDLQAYMIPRSLMPCSLHSMEGPSQYPSPILPYFRMYHISKRSQLTCFRKYAEGEGLKLKEEVKKEMGTDDSFWERRPFTKAMIQYAQQDVFNLFLILRYAASHNQLFLTLIQKPWTALV